METFNQLKNKKKKELEKAIKKQSELIEEQNKLIKYLENDLYDIDKFSKGNLIVYNDSYFLIVGEPELIGSKLRIPIRHHIYTELNAFRMCDELRCSCKLNMSGVIDYIDIYLNKTPEIKVISVRELFEKDKIKLIENYNSHRDIYKYRIKRAKEEIKKLSDEIKELEKCDKQINIYNIEDNFNNLVENYINKSFKEVAYPMNKDTEEILKYGSCYLTIE